MRQTELSHECSSWNKNHVFYLKDLFYDHLYSTFFYVAVSISWETFTQQVMQMIHLMMLMKLRN